MKIELQNQIFNLKELWSGRPGSNRRHSAWKADALPTELLPHLRFDNTQHQLFGSRLIFFKPKHKTLLCFNLKNSERETGFTSTALSIKLRLRSAHRFSPLLPSFI